MYGTMNIKCTYIVQRHHYFKSGGKGRRIFSFLKCPAHAASYAVFPWDKAAKRDGTGG